MFLPLGHSTDLNGLLRAWKYLGDFFGGAWSGVAIAWRGLGGPFRQLLPRKKNSRAFFNALDLLL